MSMDTYGIIGFTTDNVGIDRRFYTGRTDTDPTLAVSYNERRVDVYLNGIKLVGDHPGNSNHDYDIDAQTGQGSSITLKTGVALVASDVIECIGYVSLSGNTVTSHNPTPTSGDGGFNEFRNIGQASSDLLNVYLNGVLLDDSDYTSDPTTNSGTVTIGSPAITASDVVVIQVIGTLNNSNFVPASGGDFTGNVTTTGEIHTDDIKEKSTDHGVEIEAVTLKDGGGTFTGNVGIGGTADELLHLKSSTSLKPVLKIENTNDDHLNPQINLVKNTANAANNDYVGQVDFDGTNSSGTIKTYGRIQAQAKDVANTSEDGRVYIASMKDGTLDETLNVVSGKIGIGDSSPNEKLVVSDNTASEFASIIKNTHASGAGLKVIGGSGSQYSFIVRDKDDSNDNLVVTGEGKVAIGTTTTSANILTGITTGGNSSNIYLGATGTGNAELVLDASNGDFAGSDYYMLRQLNTLDVEHWLGTSGDHIFKTSAGTERMRISSGGSITKPYQPMFKVKCADGQTSRPKDNTQQIAFNNEIFDTGGNFDTSTYTFTAPVTGKYQFNVYVRIDSFPHDCNYVFIGLVTHNRTIHVSIQGDEIFGSLNGDYHPVTGSVLTDMDANDYAYVTWYQSGGSEIATIVNDSHFSGFLVG